MSVDREKSDVDVVLDYAKRIKESKAQVKSWKEEIEDRNIGIKRSKNTIDVEATLIKQKKREIADLEARRNAEERYMNKLMKEMNDFFSKQYYPKEDR